MGADGIYFDIPGEIEEEDFADFGFECCLEGELKAKSRGTFGVCLPFASLVKAVAGTGNAEPSDNFRFSAAVAQLGMLLRGSEYKGHSTFEGILKLAASAKGDDPYGYRREFIKLVETCQLLQETRRVVEVTKVH